MRKLNVGDLVYYRCGMLESWDLGKIVGIGKIFYIIEYQGRATRRHCRKLKWLVYKTK